MSVTGPVIIAANHPNSFLDAIIVSTLFKQPVYSLTRGDAFANRFFTRLLRSLNMLPVYRLSEGAQNLEHNYATFDACTEIFRKKGIVLIFSEGRCVNEWRLRVLKKGTARLAISAWKQGIPVKVIPLGINYSSFRIFGKNVILNFGEAISADDFASPLSSGRAMTDFNLTLNEQLKKLVWQVDSSDSQKLKEVFYVRQSLLKKTGLFVPAVLGWLLHIPLYVPITLLLKNKAGDHYDSIVVGLLFFLYPLYILAFSTVFYFATKHNLAWLCIVILPFTAWSCLQLKRQFR